MENTFNQEINQTLLLTKQVFMTLLNSIISQFKSSHPPFKYRDSQLYGFGNYDLEKPNLKDELETLLKGYVNGKYLYNKYREATSGKPILGTAGSAGFGTLRAGATERANVDLTQELVDLITAQRNFQANAKAIETSSTMTSAIINLRS